MPWLLVRFVLCAALITPAGYVPSESADALGACVVNLVFLVVVDALQPRQPMYRHASPSHLLTAAFDVVALGLAALSLLAGPRAPVLLNLSLTSPALLADAAPVHAGTAVTASVMTGLVMVGLVLRPQGRVLRVTSWISIALAAVFVMNAVLVALADV
jgi:hypothetical protein